MYSAYYRDSKVSVITINVLVELLFPIPNVPDDA